MIDEPEAGATPAVLRAGPDDAAFEAFLREPGVDRPLTVSDAFVYFTIGSGSLGTNYLVRAPIGAGELEGLAGPNYFDNLATDGQQVFFHTAFIPDICTFGFDEGSRAIVSVASDGEVNAWDEDYLYLMQGFVGGAAARVPR